MRQIVQAGHFLYFFLFLCVNVLVHVQLYMYIRHFDTLTHTIHRQSNHSNEYFMRRKCFKHKKLVFFFNLNCIHALTKRLSNSFCFIIYLKSLLYELYCKHELVECKINLIKIYNKLSPKFAYVQLTIRQ